MVTGPPPKPADQRRRHQAPAHGWVEIEAVPFAGRPLPKRPGGARWPAGIAAKWRAWSRMPHCTLWADSDWSYAVDSLLVAEVRRQPLMHRQRARARALRPVRDCRAHINGDRKKDG
jgi:hypothetical protein